MEVTFRVQGTGFPTATIYWQLYYRDIVAGIWLGDGQWHGVNDIIEFRGANPGGYLFSYCESITMQVTQHTSKTFSALDGAFYEYDIASGNVTLLQGVGPMTGQITNLVVPQVQVGSQIRATIGYHASNPGALAWRTFLIAHTGDWYIQKLLKTKSEVGSEGGGENTYDVGIMPNKTIGIVFRLFGHNDANYNWNWQDLYDLLENGYSSGAQPLAFNVAWMEPYPASIFSNLNAIFTSGEYNYGDILNLNCSFDYMGPEYSGAFLRGGIGQLKYGGYDEILGIEQDLVIPATTTKKKISKVLSVPITSKIAPGMGYMVEVKLGGIPGDDQIRRWEDAINIEVEQIPPSEAQFRNFTVSYKKA